MNALFWLILIASVMVLTTLIVSLYTDDVEVIKISIVITLFITFFSISGLLVEQPTAMDVYQGKTTLKYTVVDNIKTDSTVVLKKEHNN